MLVSPRQASTEKQLLNMLQGVLTDVFNLSRRRRSYNRTYSKYLLAYPEGLARPPGCRAIRSA